MNNYNAEKKTISEPMVRNSFTKLFHAFLLYNFPAEILHKFYNDQSANPFAPVNDTGQLVFHLWNENGLTSSRFINCMLKNTELLCIEHNIHMYRNLKEFFCAALCSGGFQSQIYGSVLKYLSDDIDFRGHVFRAVSTVVTLLFLNASCKILSESASASDSEHEFKIIIKQLKSGENTDCAIGIEPSFVFIAQILPVVLFLRPFSHYRVYFHEQRVEDLLWHKESMHTEKEKLYIDGQLYGRQRYFRDCDTSDLPDEMNSAEYDTWQVTRIERDYVCPIRKRVILKCGEVYGAPYSVVSFSDMAQESSIGRYDAFIQDGINNCLWIELEKKQQILLGMYNKTVKITYDKSSQILIVNNNSTVGGVQAKIFSTMLKLFIDKKRDIFEWRDLAANDELICDPFSTGLSTRLSRLMDILKKIKCGCTIEKMTRGKYKLVCNSEIVYTEKS